MPESPQVSTGQAVTGEDKQNILLLVSTIPLSLAAFWGCKRKKYAENDRSFMITVLICVLILPWLLLYRMTCCAEAIFVLLWLLMYFIMVKSIPEFFPKSFTAGESFVVCQILLWFLSKFSKHMYELFTSQDPTIKKEYIFGMVAVTAVLICCILYYLLSASSVKLFYVIYGIVGAAFVIPVLYLLLNVNPLVWLLRYLNKEPYRISLFIYWLLCSILAVIVVYIYNTKSTDSRKVSTVTRKYFHFLVIAVYLPGLVYDPELLKMSSFIVLGVFLLMEHIRLHNIPPLASILEPAFHTFTDEKDSGYLILTHIYLLVGTSLPLWIVNDVQGSDIVLYSGLLSVGIGDTAASLIGSKLGRLKLPGTKKTVEGTLASVTFQVLFLYVFSYCGLFDSSILLMRPVISIILTSLLEATTDQIDNLILPLFMFFTIK